MLLILALLICDAAAGLASGLARGLALAAAAVLCALAKVAGLNRFDMLHCWLPPNVDYPNIISRFFDKVNINCEFFRVFRVFIFGTVCFFAIFRVFLKEYCIFQKNMI